MLCWLGLCYLVWEVYAVIEFTIMILEHSAVNGPMVHRSCFPNHTGLDQDDHSWHWTWLNTRPLKHSFGLVVYIYKYISQALVDYNGSDNNSCFLLFFFFTFRPPFNPPCVVNCQLLVPGPTVHHLFWPNDNNQYSTRLCWCVRMFVI